MVLLIKCGELLGVRIWVDMCRGDPNASFEGVKSDQKDVCKG
jgi:hypothetical protein